MRFNVKFILIFFIFLTLGMSFYRYDPKTGQWIKLEGLNEYGEVSPIGNGDSGYCNKAAWEIRVSSRAKVEIPEFSFTKIAIPITSNIETLPDGTFRVPLKEYAEWKIIIKISSTSPIDDVVIVDIFQPQLGVQNPPLYVSQGTVGYEYGPGQMYHTKVTWTIGDNFSGNAELQLKVYTKLNPGGQQEYTSKGTYYLNKGATLNYTIGGTGYSVTTGEILVIAYEKNGDKKKK
ncbi:MAG: hypothetical protein N2380_08525 [bacterium]|nr:hypothetical protein [bacterium]